MKISSARRWRRRSERLKARRLALGRKHTEEAKRKISLGLKREWADPVARKKRTLGIQKSLRRPSVRRKLSRSIAKAYESLELRKQRSEAVIKQWKNPRIRQNRVRGIRRMYSNPVTRRLMLKNKTGIAKHQRLLKKVFERQGWEVLYRGWPDFVLVKGAKIRFIEAKSKPREKLSEFQKAMHFVFKRYLGFDVETVHFAKGKFIENEW